MIITFLFVLSVADNKAIAKNWRWGSNFKLFKGIQSGCSGVVRGSLIKEAQGFPERIDQGFR